MGKRKKTPEERAAERAYSEDLVRRMLDRIERSGGVEFVKAYRSGGSAWRAYSQELDRRLLAAIERYRRLSAEKHAAEGGC